MANKYVARMVVALAASTVLAGGLVACSSSDTATQTSATQAANVDYSSLKIDNTAWQYDAEHDVYYQVGVQYALNPANSQDSALGIFVPGAYMSATDNGEGTWTASVNEAGSVGKYTADNAPWVMPIDTPGYAAQDAPEGFDYSKVGSYTDAGMIYVWPGLRGRTMSGENITGNAPAGVIDAKAAIRYVRYNAGNLPGNTDSTYTFGMSGGGAQTAIIAASGDSDLYTPYLNEIGAVMTDASGKSLSDATKGTSAWCPITTLDAGNLGYEWMMGQFADTDTRADGTWTKAYSDDLAAAYADYINGLGLQDDKGNTLSLTDSAEGTKLAGSYYDLTLKTIEDSLNNFLQVTSFPYTPNNSMQAGMDASTAGQTGASDSSSGERLGEPPLGGPGGLGGSTEESTTYQTVEDFIAALNENGQWVTYDAATNTAHVENLEGFVVSSKNPSKQVGAFDSATRSQGENQVFGEGDNPLHFSQLAAEVLKANEDKYKTYSDWSDDYSASEYESDITQTDSTGTTVATRQNMYDPLYYLLGEGKGESTVAQNWRIRTGLFQGDTALGTELNLALALNQYGVNDVDFATIWGLGHTMAELEGDSTTNFMSWIDEVEGV